MSYQLPGEKKIIEKWDKIPGNITFVYVKEMKLVTTAVVPLEDVG